MRKIINIKTATEVNNLIAKVGLYGYNILTYHYTAIKHELYYGLWYIDTGRLFIRKIK